jgi:hypothetical protein
MKYPIESPKKAGAWLYDKGANVLSLDGKSPSPIEWSPWKDERQELEQVDQLPWSQRNGVGVIVGVNDLRCMDLDDLRKWGAVEKILDAFGFPHTYPWIVESGSGQGAHIWFRCEDDDRFGGCDEYLPKREGAFDHLELRWKNHQTAVPPTTHPDTGLEYTFRHNCPERAPWEVSPDEVEGALKAVGKPKRSTRATSTPNHASTHDDPDVKTIRSALAALPDHIGGGYGDWLRIIMAVRDGAPDTDTAEQLLKEWRPEEDPGEYSYKLDSLEDGPPQGVEPVTVGTLFGTAKNHGWTHSNSSDAAKERVDEVVEKVQKEDAGAELIFQHLGAFARLDTADFAVAKEKISDVVNLNDFQAAIREKRREVEREDFQKGSDLPTIQLSGRPGREVVDEAKEALHDWNDPPRLFQRGTEPVQIATDDQGRAIIRELPDAVMDDCLDRAADFYRTSEKKGAVRADLSKRYVDRIMQTVDLPPLNSIVEVPVVREDGSILDKPGYDEVSRLYYQPDEDLTIPEIPREPNEKQIQAAKEAIWKPLQDFPFVDQASRANALALMLTPIVRPFLGEQNVPLAIVDATVQGTGKTLFVKVVSITSTGRPAATMNAPEGDEEWRKQITAQLLQGASIIAVDNVRGRLQSAPLEQALTTSLWQDRVLGKSQQVELPQRATWIATGNNVQPKGDMKRRVYPIRMDAEMERPWMGRDFEIDNLQQWTKNHRGELVAALLTLARGWFTAGQPAPETELIGSFEKWTRTVGGILEHAGITSFLDNLGEMLETVDDEAAEWTGFLAALHQFFQYEFEHGGREEPTFTSNELDTLIRESYEKDPSFRDQHLGEIIEQLPGYLVQKLDRGEKISQSLGNMFANRRGRRFGPQEWYIEIAYTQNRAKRWVVRSGQSQAGVNNESNESSYTPAGETPPPTLDEGGGSSQQSGVEPDSSDSSKMEPDDEIPF